MDVFALALQLRSSGLTEAKAGLATVETAASRTQGSLSGVEQAAARSGAALGGMGTGAAAGARGVSAALAGVDSAATATARRLLASNASVDAVRTAMLGLGHTAATVERALAEAGAAGAGVATGLGATGTAATGAAAGLTAASGAADRAGRSAKRTKDELLALSASLSNTSNRAQAFLQGFQGITTQTVAAGAAQSRLRAALDPVAAGYGRAAAGAGVWTRATTVATGAAARMAPGLNGVRSALMGMAVQAIGTAGPVGSLASNLLLFGAGGPIALGVAAGAAAIAIAWRLITREAREAARAQDELVASLAKQAADGMAPTARAARDLAAAIKDAREEGERLQRLGEQATAPGLTGLFARFQLPGARRAAAEAATAVNQGQLNAQQAQVDLLTREADGLAETIRLRGSDNDRKRAAVALQRELTRRANEHTLTLPQQNALLAANAALEDALAGKKERKARAERSEAELRLELIALGASSADNLTRLAVLEQEITARLDRGNISLADRVRLLAERRAIQEQLFRDDLLPERMAPRREGPQARTDPNTIARPESGVMPTALRDAALGTVQIGTALPTGTWLSEFDKQMAKLREGFAASLAGALGDGIAAGFEAAFSGGGIGAGFKALAGALLSGLGSAMIQFGSAALVASSLMGSIFNALASFLPGGAVVASLAMIAAGAAIKGAASAAFGGGMGGGFTGNTGAARSPAPITNTYRVPLYGTAASRTANVERMQPVTQYNSFWSDTDPVLQRRLSNTMAQGKARGLAFGGA